MSDHARVYPHGRRRHPPWPIAVGVLQVVLGSTAVLHWAYPALGYVLLLTGPSILLAAQRKAPAWAVIGVNAAALGFVLIGGWAGPVIPGVVAAVINAVLRGKRIAAWCALGGLWLGTALFRAFAVGEIEPARLAWGLGGAVLLAGFAELIDNRRQRGIAYRKLWAEERRRREAQTQQQAGEERLRIARELHDVLAHSLSLIRVRASVALELMDSNPQEVRSALLAIKEASGSGLEEVRGVLYGLRGQDAPRSPAPDLGRLDELVEQSRTAGLTVELTRSAENGGRAVPAAVGLAGYRIVQEALTNVFRHSLARTAAVHVHHAGWAVLIGVADPGPARTKDGDGDEGSGVVGIMERAASLGGTAEAGPRPGGGFEVRVALPIIRETR